HREDPRRGGEVPRPGGGEAETGCGDGARADRARVGIARADGCGAYPREGGLMRRLLFILLLVLVPALLAAQQKAPTGADNVAHGAEKVSHEVAHPNEEHGNAETEPKFLGLPAWIFKLVNMLLFIGVLGWLIGGPIKKALAERGSGIRKAAAEALERRVKADQVASDIQ